MKKENFVLGAAVGTLVSYAITSEPVRNFLNFAEKNLKSSDHNLIGCSVGTVKKVVGNVGNVVKASPFTQLKKLLNAPKADYLRQLDFWEDLQLFPHFRQKL